MKVDITALNKLVEQKWLTRKEHFEFPLLIYNYTHLTQNQGHWTPETLMCRGLIVTPGGDIVARPLPKFFNIAEHELEKLPDLPLQEHFDVYDKLDGSLGILYKADNRYFISTRGSFESEQAVEATKILKHKYFDIVFNDDYTYLFEIIYPENRIVVDYKDKRDLHLLAVINKETGEDLDKGIEKYKWSGDGPQNVFPEPEKFAISDIEAIQKMAKDEGVSTEGFVVRFSSGVRAKVKYDEYVRLHRLLTGVTARRIWDLLRNKQDIEKLVDKVPEEFKTWVLAKKKELEGQFKEIEKEAQKVFKKVKKLKTRKEQANYIMKNYKYTGIIFQMLDKRDYAWAIWNILKPKAEKAFYNNEEEA